MLFDSTDDIYTGFHQYRYQFGLTTLLDYRINNKWHIGINAYASTRKLSNNRTLTRIHTAEALLKISYNETLTLNHFEQFALNSGIRKKDLLRYSIAVIYIWFGALKFFPELSPAEELAKSTISILTFHFISNPVLYSILAVWETLIGVFLIFNLFPRWIITLALIHMLGTFTPLLIVSDVTFKELPFSLTLVGQYIMKNLVVISALIAIYPSKNSIQEKINSDLLYKS